MTGLWALINSSGEALPEGVLSAFGGVGAPPGATSTDFRPAPHVWARNICRPITDAPSGAVTSPGGTLHLLLHGEIYNTPELARRLGVEHPSTCTIADGPALAAIGIERCGLSFVQEMNGSYVLLAWFPDRREVYLANDRYGLRPQYAAWDGDLLMVAPRVQAIHRSWRRDTELDLRGTAEFFAVQFPMDNRTHVRGIEVLAPGTIFAVAQGGFRATQYWDFPYPDKSLEGSEVDLRDELARRLAVAVNRQLPARCALGVPLSGGLDSRTLAAFAARGVPSLNTFTFGPEGGMERKFAKQAAERMSAVNHAASPDSTPWRDNFLTSAAQCDGMSSALHGHILLLLPVIAENVGVVLDGLSGDFILGSGLTPNMLNGRLHGGFAKWLYSNKYNSGFEPDDLRRLFVRKEAHLSLDELIQPLGEKLRQCRSPRLADCADYVNFRQRQRRFIINGNTLLRTVVEVRTPFYDYDLMDFALALPPQLRIGKYLYKRALGQMFPELADVPYTPRGERLGDLSGAPAGPSRKSLRGQAIAVARRCLPRAVKSLLRRALARGGEPGKIDYPAVFRQHIVPLCAEYSDAAQGWTHLTDFSVIERSFRHLGSRDSSRAVRTAVRLSVWITYQMYRQQADLGQA